MVWNKVELNRSQYVVLRRLFFQKKKYFEIQTKTGLTPRVFQRIARENNWFNKRNRYYRFVCFWCYTNNISIKSKCEQLELLYESVKRVKRMFNIATKRFVHNKRITEIDKDTFIERYNEGKTGKEIAKQFGFATAKTVYDALNEANIDRRPPKKRTIFNVDYFEKIDTYDKSYILGLLLTDGYVIRDYSGVAIQLTISDRYLLEKIASRLGPSCTLININCAHKRLNMPGARDMARLSCYCGQIANSLKRFGMVKNKTSILQCPHIKKGLLSAFARGLWDGDGSLGISKYGVKWATLVSKSHRFCEGLMNLCSSFVFGITGTSLYHIYIKGGDREIVRFWKWLYSDNSDLFLRRKYEKVQNYIG